jgi:hypothetical protein
MPWTGGYPATTNREGIIIPTGLIALGDENRRGVFVASVGVQNWSVVGTNPPLNGQALIWSVSAQVRWRRLWTFNGTNQVASGSEELVIEASIVPVGVSDSFSSVTVTSVRWSVWRLT